MEEATWGNENIKYILVATLYFQISEKREAPTPPII